jgi:hypothetical protein
MPVPEELPQITIFRTRYPDFREIAFLHQPEQKSGIVAIGLLSPHSLGFDFRRVADPNLDAQFCQRPLEPACVAGDSYGAACYPCRL